MGHPNSGAVVFKMLRLFYKMFFCLQNISTLKKLYLSYSSLGKILSFIVKKNNYFISFIFFLQIYLTSLQGKEYFTEELEPEPVGAR